MTVPTGAACGAKLLAEPQAAVAFGVSARTLRRWRAAGAVPHLRTPGGRIFYVQADVDACLATMRVDARDQ